MTSSSAQMLQPRLFIFDKERASTLRRACTRILYMSEILQTLSVCLVRRPRYGGKRQRRNRKANKMLGVH